MSLFAFIFETLKAALQISTKIVLSHKNRLFYSDVDAWMFGVCSPVYMLTANVSLQEEIRAIFSAVLEWLRTSILPISFCGEESQCGAESSSSSPSASAAGLKTKPSLLPTSVPLFLWTRPLPSVSVPWFLLVSVKPDGPCKKQVLCDPESLHLYWPVPM